MTSVTERAPVPPRVGQLRFPGLDAVRALGASAVVATHCAFWTGRSLRGPFSGVLARLDLGVALFFVLSGFLLFRPFAVARLHGRTWPSTPTYLARRALRILPAYWLVVAVALLTLKDNEPHRTLLDWTRYLTLTQIYGLNWQRTGLWQMWSLATEVAFYLCLPLLAALVLRTSRRPVAAVLLLMAVSPLWHAFVTLPGGLDIRVAGLWLPGYLDWFGAGMLLALVEVAGETVPPAGWRLRLYELAAAPGTCWAAALALLAVATTAVAGTQGLAVLSGWEQLVKNVLYVGIAVLVVLPLVLRPHDRSPVRTVLASRPVRWLGEVSYGIFLWHLLVLQAVTSLRGQRLFTGSWTVTFLIVWPTSVLVASVSYVFLERPLLRLKDRVRSRSPNNADQVTASPVMHSA